MVGFGVVNSIGTIIYGGDPARRRRRKSANVRILVPWQSAHRSPGLPHHCRLVKCVSDSWRQYAARGVLYNKASMCTGLDARARPSAYVVVTRVETRSAKRAGIIDSDYYFLRTKRPMTSMSNPVPKKTRTASRGEHTIGS